MCRSGVWRRAIVDLTSVPALKVVSRMRLSMRMICWLESRTIYNRWWNHRWEGNHSLTIIGRVCLSVRGAILKGIDRWWDIVGLNYIIIVVRVIAVDDIAALLWLVI